MKIGDVEVIDNYLPKEQWQELNDLLTSGKFGWYFTDKITLEQTDESDQFYFSHALYNQLSLHQSELFECCYPLLKLIEPKALVRVKANLYINQGKGVVEHTEHTDYPWPHKGALYSINTCDGYTKFGEQKIESVSNRIIFFDPSKPHNSTSCSNAKFRCNINFNYF